MFPLFALVAAGAAGQSATTLAPNQVEKVDHVVTTVLTETGVPSASIAVVRDGNLVLVKAYGKASESVPVARSDLPYPIASNSKQFTAMGLLLLEDEGKLSLDDRVSKWLPHVVDADRITVRQLLSHTSGLQDYSPQDYAIPAMSKPTTPEAILKKWATKPLDYEPGTQWQYSNTGYVAAGIILEKVAGEPLLTFLNRRIFGPLGMHPIDAESSRSIEPAGYHRNALGPIKVTTPLAHGWMWAAGELAMSAEDFAKWDVARINRAVLPADDWADQEQQTTLGDGTLTPYGLGVFNEVLRGRRVIDHSGGAPGFISKNTVYLKSRAAIVVLTNGDFSGAVESITQGIEEILIPTFRPSVVDEKTRLEDAVALYNAVMSGDLPAASLTDDLKGYFDADTLKEYRTSLAPLGTPKIEALSDPTLRGGFVNRNFALKYADGRRLTLVTYSEPGPTGRWEQFIITE